jgi:hypothetical protein
VKLHFWKRVEGSVAEKARVAQLDEESDFTTPRGYPPQRGPLVRYHAACPSFAEGEEFLRWSCWHWRYLGVGLIYSIDGNLVEVEGRPTQMTSGNGPRLVEAEGAKP